VNLCLIIGLLMSHTLIGYSFVLIRCYRRAFESGDIKLRHNPVSCNLAEPEIVDITTD